MVPQLKLHEGEKNGMNEDVYRTVSQAGTNSVGRKLLSSTCCALRAFLAVPSSVLLFYSKLFLRRPEIQFMCPQLRSLLTQPQIRLPHRLRTHLLARSLILSVRILDRPVGNRMRHMDALGAILLCQTLRQHPDTRSARAVCRKLRVRPQGAHRTREDQRPFLLPTVRESLLTMVFEQQFHPFLAERKGPTDVIMQALGEILVRFLEERFLGRMFYVENANAEFQALKGRVGADVGEGVGEVGRVGVGGEGLDDGVWGR